MTKNIRKNNNFRWEEIKPVKKLDNMLFEDAGYTYVMRKL